MQRHPATEWTDVQEKLQGNQKRPWSLLQKAKTEREQGDIVLEREDTQINNISPPTTATKARKGEEIFATLPRNCNHGNNTNLRAVQSKWPGIWGSNFWMRSNIFSFKNWRNWIQKHPAGCGLLPTSGIWAVLFSGIGDSDGYSFITTERNLIIHPEDFAGF